MNSSREAAQRLGTLHGPVNRPMKGLFKSKKLENLESYKLKDAEQGDYHRKPVKSFKQNIHGPRSLSKNNQPESKISESQPKTNNRSNVSSTSQRKAYDSDKLYYRPSSKSPNVNISRSNSRSKNETQNTLSASLQKKADKLLKKNVKTKKVPEAIKEVEPNKEFTEKKETKHLLQKNKEVFVMGVNNVDLTSKVSEVKEENKAESKTEAKQEVKEEPKIEAKVPEVNKEEAKAVEENKSQNVLPVLPEPVNSNANVNVNEQPQTIQTNVQNQEQNTQNTAIVPNIQNIQNIQNDQNVQNIQNVQAPQSNSTLPQNSQSPPESMDKSNSQQVSSALPSSIEKTDEEKAEEFIEANTVKEPQVQQNSQEVQKDSMNKSESSTDMVNNTMPIVNNFNPLNAPQLPQLPQLPNTLNFNERPTNSLPNNLNFLSTKTTNLQANEENSKKPLVPSKTQSQFNALANNCLISLTKIPQNMNNNLMLNNVNKKDYQLTEEQQRIADHFASHTMVVHLASAKKDNVITNGPGDLRNVPTCYADPNRIEEERRWHENNQKKEEEEYRRTHNNNINNLNTLNNINNLNNFTNNFTNTFINNNNNNGANQNNNGSKQIKLSGNFNN